VARPARVARIAGQRSISNETVCVGATGTAGNALRTTDLVAAVADEAPAARTGAAAVAPVCDGAAHSAIGDVRNLARRRFVTGRGLACPGSS
jgi:hypothetical protein